MNVLTADFLSFINYQKGQTVAIAVSGGSDSLALLFIACEKLGAENIIAITFDHKIRKESHAEALYVKSLCEKLKCKHILLAANEDSPIKPSQDEARRARYNHILAYCHESDISYLFLGHHQDDQAETYYIRLYQKSHLWGLSAMPLWHKKGKINIIRPLLNTSSADLKKYLNQKKIKWVEDPSNQKDKYLRVRIRKLLQEKKLDKPSLSLIQSYRQNMMMMMKKWLDNHGQSLSSGFMVLEKQAFEAMPKEFKLHLLRYVIQVIGHGIYGLSLKEIDEKYTDILSPKLFSLHHCLIYSDSQKIYIQYEYRKERKKREILRWENYIFYDNRFHIFCAKNKDIEVSYIGDFKKTYNKELDYLIDLSCKKKYRYIKALPIVKYNERELVFPLITGDFWQQKDICVNYNNQIEAMACQKYFIDLSF